MTAPRDPEPETERLVFSAILRPHRSLTPRGVAGVICFFAAFSAAMAFPFLMLGAWPVAGFLGLEAGLVALALLVSHAQSANEEQIFLSRMQLLIRRLDWRGAIREVSFNPLWSRLEREEHPEWGLEKLSVVQGQRRSIVGACLNNEDRADFAQAFSQALAEAKR